MADSDFSFGGVTVPIGTKRLYVTATLVPSMGDPRIQPTGFPDIGPVFYPDPSGTHGQICLIESEASMANRLEEVALADRYTGNLVPALAGLPYIRVEKSETFKTASTIDGHRFASEYLMTSKLRKESDKAKQNEKLVDFVLRELEGSKGHIPAANVPRIFRIAMELDPLSLIHGFQISLKDLTFVGLRSPRALTACIVGLNAQPVGVPGVRFDPIGTGDAGQAIFRKERIVAERIEAKFALDVGLLAGLGVGAAEEQEDNSSHNRRHLLIAVSLWKIARFLEELSDGHRLRSECDLALESATYTTNWNGAETKFDFEELLKVANQTNVDKPAKGSLQDLIKKADLPSDRSPLILEFGN